MSIKALVDHIRDLVRADPTLSGLKLGLIDFGIPKTLPAIYLDGIVFDDNNRSNHAFNLCYVTEDMSIVQLDYAQAILKALQQSPAIRASTLLPRPEPENKRNRWIIPCVFYANRL